MLPLLHTLELPQIQDTVAICPGQLSQHLALAALQHGGQYVHDAIAALEHNRQLIADALSPLGKHGEGWVGGDGAIYYFAKLPERFAAAPAGSAAVGDAAAPAGVTTSDTSAAAAAAAAPASFTAAAPAGVEGAAAGVNTSNTSAAAAAAAGAAAAGKVGEFKSCSDEDVVAWLIREHGVCVIPGSACGAPGWIRVAYANLSPQQCEVAAARLKAGLQQLLELERVPCVS
jgi:aspartate/methionine/tyrosine aminotransferase